MDAFKKLRNNKKLEDDKDIKPLPGFTDEFTTVSIQENSVIKDVAKIAQEVNKHHHTKTCSKHDTTCRFGYPRFPAPYTIIVKPCHEESIEEKEETLTKN